MGIKVVKKIGSLTLYVVDNEGTTLLHWVGKSVEVNPNNSLKPVLDEIFPVLGKKLIITFGRLKNINSATVVPLINFIKKLNQKKIFTVIHYVKRIPWQISVFKSISPLIDKFDHIMLMDT
ncbi:MAG: hypothetical protein JW881_10050 [Spirochaetales bacterium]|nr:hypothetical protein [Spirochaetales bacterium]